MMIREMSKLYRRTQELSYLQRLQIKFNYCFAEREKLNLSILSREEKSWNLGMTKGIEHPGIHCSRQIFTDNTFLTVTPKLDYSTWWKCIIRCD